MSSSVAAARADDLRSELASHDSVLDWASFASSSNYVCPHSLTPRLFLSDRHPTFRYLHRASSRTSKEKEFTEFIERVLDAAEVSITDIRCADTHLRHLDGCPAEVHSRIPRDPEIWVCRASTDLHRRCTSLAACISQWSGATNV